MKYAWIENAQIRDIAHSDPALIYTPEIAAFYDTLVPDDAASGDGWVDGALVKPEPVVPPAPEPVVVVPPKVSPIQYKLLFTSAERIAIATARTTDPVLEDLYSILDDTRLTEVDLALKSTQDALDYLIFKGLLDVDRKAEILTGEVK